VALLIIATAGLTIGLAISIASIDEIQLAHGKDQSAAARAAALGCAEDALERLRNSFTAQGGTLSYSEYSCIIDTVINGSNATITATGTVGIFNQKITIGLNSAMTISVWEEN
jgi:hypothetical protein